MKLHLICIIVLLKMLTVEDVKSQASSLIDDFPDFFSSIIIDSSSARALVDETDSISVNITDYGWVEVTIPTKEAVLITHLYDLNQVVRSFRFSPSQPYVLSNGLILNQSSLEVVEGYFNKQSSSYGSTRLFVGEFVYHFSTADSKEILTSIEIRKEDGTSFSKNFVLDSTRLRRFYDRLCGDMDWIMESPPENLIPAMKTIGLVDLDDYPHESIYRNLGDNRFQYQVQFQHYFLDVIANVIYNPKTDSLIYFSLSFDDKYVYELAGSGSANNWRSTNSKNIVGFWCSIGGSPPHKMNETLGLINERRYTPFIDWMQSMNPEIRLYGAIGVHMYRFRHKNHVEAGAIHQANEILAENRKIYGCQGCFFGSYRQQEIVQLSKLYQIYSAFVETGSIR